jgi:hypothetical protein
LERQFRSLIKKYFPVELLVELENVTKMMSIDNNGKYPYVKYLLDKFNVPYEPLGSGTNRYGINIDGYAVKIALDKAGMIDNQREFKYAKKLYPSVVKVYECCPNGLLSVSEYVTIFSLNDYYSQQDNMREILAEISAQFLVGDIGVSKVNYINWGTRNDGTICILDFAYIYSLSYKGFLCTCEDQGMLEADTDCNYYQCPICRKKFEFKDLRKRITKKDEAEEIGDITLEGYCLHDDNEVQEVDYDKSPDKRPKKKKKKEKPEKKSRSELTDQQSMLQRVNDFLAGRSTNIQLE